MRTALILVLLLVSHGMALWLGKRSARPAVVPVDTGLAAEAAPPAKPLRLEDFLPPPSEEGGEPEPMPEEDYRITRAREMKALRDAIPADADVEAMVRAGAGKDRMIDDKTLAAFGVWMDRDPLAAMRWHHEWEDGASTSHFGFELRRHFGEAGGLSRMNEYLAAIPEARWSVLGPIKEIARERGNGFLIDLAKKLEAKGDQRSMLFGAFKSTEGLAPRLGEIRGMLGEGNYGMVLGQIAGLEGSLDLLEAVRQAGFPEEDVSSFEQAALKKSAESMSVSDYVRSSSGAGGDDRERWLQKSLPAFGEWEEDFGDGRISGDEVISRIVAVAPDAADMDADLREFIFPNLAASNPAKAIMWLQGHGGDWQQAVAKVTSNGLPDLSAEEAVDITAGLSDADQESSGMAKITADQFGNWFARNPDQALAAARAMPEGALKKRVLTGMQGGGR